ncbi:hypothetical protein [Halanaerobium hydrogeniformans]|uniref:Outer membrane protein beta-barrel domain-containing protein n=1 Tax=Halanaerobium hydrogeniformans TaxID=656519 RepID=E4RJ04_HALHG|nr:hypothetical protein [Halanaerobium hydrogeniformans]ADQ15224.1 hypothetical protein Halsa_1806 [Halanaerobium hydrogeniformans]
MEKKFIILLFGILIILLISSSVSAQTSMEERIRLIEASQNLQRQMEEEKTYANHNSLAVFFTNYKINGNEVNPGLRLGVDVPVSGLSIMFEGIYYRAKSNGDAFIGVKFSPLEYQMLTPYIGAGVGVTGKANYQVFLGTDVSENFFIEAKYIDEELSSEDSNVAAVAGFQIKF